MQTQPADFLPLKPLDLAVLLALGERMHHGYSLMQALRDDAQLAVPVHTGPLYRTLKKLLERDLVQEASDAGKDDVDPRRGSSYRLTRLGRKVLAAELARLEGMIERGSRIGLAGGRAR